MSKLSDIARVLAYFSVTIFFSTITVITIYFIHSMLPLWETAWYRGWDDFNRISLSINESTEVTRPLQVSLSDLVKEVRVMNGTIDNKMTMMNGTMENMNASVEKMRFDVKHMAVSIPPQMGVMSGQMGVMQNNMTPGGMMRNMMPW